VIDTGTLDVDATQRRARKSHACSHCEWKWRRAGRTGTALRIEPGQPYIESYGLGEPFHPARYHLLCWTEMMAK